MLKEVCGYGQSPTRAWVLARKLSHEQEVELREKVHSYRPDRVLPLETCHVSGRFWTVEDVKKVVKQWYGMSYAYIGSYRNLLRRCGFSYQRREQVYKSRPSEMDVTDFKLEHPDGVIVALDQMSVYLQASLLATDLVASWTNAIGTNHTAAG